MSKKSEERQEDQFTFVFGEQGMDTKIGIPDPEPLPPYAGFVDPMLLMNVELEAALDALAALYGRLPGSSDQARYMLKKHGKLDKDQEVQP